MREKPGWVEAILGNLFWPDTDPPAVRRAGEAVRELSNGLSWTIDDFRQTTSRLDNEWDGRASKAFQDVADKVEGALKKYRDELVAQADQLGELADFLEKIEDQSKMLWLAIIGTLAAGAAFVMFTGGLSAGAAAAACSAEVSGLAALAVRMGFVLTRAAWAMGVTQHAMATAGSMFALGFALSGISSVAVKGIFMGQNVLDPANWTPADLSKMLLDGTLVMGFRGLAEVPAVAARLNGPTGVPSLSRYLLGGAVSGAGLSAIFSVISQFGFQHKSLTDVDNYINVAKSAGIGFVSGTLAAAGFHRSAVKSAMNPKISKLSKPGNPMPPVITDTDVMRGLTGTFSDMINYVINYEEAPQLPQVPPRGDQPSLPGPSAIKPPKPPQHIVGGGTHIVRGGESLSAIAQRVYGNERDYWRIAEANGIGPPHIIHPGQALKIPRIPVSVP